MIHFCKELLWNNVGSKKEERIKKIISNYDYVSFDIFDTVIRRAVPEPNYVFNLIKRELNDSVFQAFEENRIVAAKMAWEKARMNGRMEITLSDIYDCMPQYYQKHKDKLIRIEEEVETRIAFPDLSMKRIYEWCINEGKKVFFVSDMYLSIKVIKKILEKCGYNNYERILLSSEENKTKRNGELFNRLVEICGSPDRIVHIGDHYKSDFIKAKAKGIRAVKIPRIPQRTLFCANKKLKRNKSNYDKLLCLLNYGSDIEAPFFYKYGFECLGPALVGACRQIHEMTMDSNYDRIFFLSRDGYMLKQIYDNLYSDKRIRSEYMYVSRKSIQFPLLCSYDRLQDYFILNGEKKIWTYKMFCNRLGIDSDSALEDWIKAGLSEGFRFSAKHIGTDKRIESFYELYKDKVKNQSDKAAKVVEAYLNQIGFSGNVLIVDSGGYGTTQMCLEAFCSAHEINAIIKGAYLWFFGKSNVNAVAFPYKEHTSHGGETQITEIPLTAHEGTTEGYRVTDEFLIEPELGEYEYLKYPENECAINEMQKGAISFANLYKNCLELELLDRETSYQNTKRVSRRPRVEEAKKFGDLLFMSDHQEAFLAKPKPIVQYIKNRKLLIEDFSKANWKIGFLKRLLRVPLPYYEIISCGRMLKRHY